MRCSTSPPRSCPPRELGFGGNTGTAWGEKAALRLVQCRGERDRMWETLAGTIELRIQQLDKDS